MTAVAVILHKVIREAVMGDIGCVGGDESGCGRI